ncbi:MAG: MATE family efflux transporter [Haloferacaceae archaeon]
MFNPIGDFYRLVAARLARVGLVDEARGRRIADLAWPRFLTMFARYLHQVADVAMVGLAIGPAAIAGLAFASIYWGLANAFSLGLVGGTISQVSQRFGAEKYDELDLAVKQSIWVGLALTLPFILVYVLFADPLIGLVGDDATAIGLGAAYLQILALGLVFNLLNLVASRTLAGADDTWIAMSIRATGAFANIVFNAVFIFGLGMGVEGAALGTVLAEGFITVSLAWGFLTGSLPVIGAFPVTLSLGRPVFDRDMTRQLLTIAPPLMAQKLARSLARFPLFALLAIFGPTVVAAFEVARRIRSLMRSTGNGFSMSASSLVGQELGRGDESGATNYAGDVIRFSAVVYVSAAILVFAFARPLAHFFGDDPGAIDQTVPFIRIAAVSFVALGMDYSFNGILKAAGDTKWSLYGRLVGQYGALIPITFLGTITPLGVTAVFLAMVAETGSAALITGHRVLSGKWKLVNRRHRPSAADD